MESAQLEWKNLYKKIKKSYEKYDEKDKLLIKKAFEFANEKHKNQKRDNGAPYIIHPVRVAKIVFENKRSSNFATLISSALLHDTLEDTYTSYKELQENFGEDIASLVMEVTSASVACKIEGKEHYLSHKMQHMTSYALFVKLADRLDNLSDLSNSSKEKKERVFKQTKTIIEYLSKHITFTSSQRKLVDKLEKILNEEGNL